MNIKCKSCKNINECSNLMIEQNIQHPNCPLRQKEQRKEIKCQCCGGTVFDNKTTCHHCLPSLT